MGENNKQFDLEERTARYAEHVAVFCNKLPKTLSNIEHCKQIIRSSGSVASNYIEANESLSKKDLVYRLKICRKEAKESALWARIMKKTNTEDALHQLEIFYNEAIELKKIFSVIITKNGG